MISVNVNDITMNVSLGKLYHIEVSMQAEAIMKIPADAFYHAGPEKEEEREYYG
ncbi:MAG: hypothetical protein U0L49_04640 [Eubacterium sp.]|nr:hypothetical protein [Eubacterium sp.]